MYIYTCKKNFIYMYNIKRLTTDALPPEIIKRNKYGKNSSEKEATSQKTTSKRKHLKKRNCEQGALEAG